MFVFRILICSFFHIPWKSELFLFYVWIKNALTKCRFRRNKWKEFFEAPSSESWKLHNHSSDTFFWTRARRTVYRDHLHHKGYKAKKPARAEAKVLSEKCCLQCWIATNKATMVQIGQWYFSTELAEDPAGVEGPWTRFAVERQMIYLCAFRGRGRMKRTDQSAERFSVFWWSKK